MIESESKSVKEEADKVISSVTHCIEPTMKAENQQMIVYIAGPMSGLPDFNRSAFRTAAGIIRDQGFDAVCPADFPRDDSWERMMQHAIPRMLSCDRVVLLSLWERSRGARLEAFIARELGMKVETLGEFLLSLPTKPDEDVRGDGTALATNEVS